MAITYKIWNFPTLGVKSQVFYIPGAAIDGGYTSGGASIMSPEPGGRSTLEIQLSLQTKEWNSPLVSWLMSKANGEIFKIRLTRTPQLYRYSDLNFTGDQGIPWEGYAKTQPVKWSNGQNWDDDGFITYGLHEALSGTNLLFVWAAPELENLSVGHLIGYNNVTYKIDELTHHGTSIELRIKPPFRSTIPINAEISLRPYFTGTIVNGSEFKTNYDIQHIGAIQPGRIVFRESIVNV